MNPLKIAGVLCLAYFLQGRGTLPIMADNGNAVDVGVSRLGYNKGPLRSNGFNYCSAVILDYGDEAFLAHALPGISQTYPTVDGFGRPRVGAGNVVEHLKLESGKLGLNPRDAEAIVNAGGKFELETIIGNLKREGIRIRSADMYGAPLPSMLGSMDVPYRNILFNPSSNQIFIEVHKPKK